MLLTDPQTWAAQGCPMLYLDIWLDTPGGHGLRWASTRLLERIDAATNNRLADGPELFDDLAETVAIPGKSHHE